MHNAFFDLMYIELLKLKRSKVGVLCLICTIAVVGLQLAATLARTDFIALHGWNAFWNEGLNTWIILMFPLLISLICVRLKHLEQRHNGVQLMHTLPINCGLWYVSKFTVALGIAFIACLGFILLHASAMGMLSVFGHQSEAAFTLNVSSIVGNLLITSLPIVASAFLLSWVVKNGVVVTGICFTLIIAANLMMRSSEYWYFNPWAYMSVGYLVKQQETQDLAIMLSVMTGFGLTLLGAVVATKFRDTSP